MFINSVSHQKKSVMPKHYHETTSIDPGEGSDTTEEDIVYDGSELLNGKLGHRHLHSLPRRRHPRISWSSKFHRLLRTLALCLAFFVLGLCIAVPGPTLLDLQMQVDVSVTQITSIFAARSTGYLLGSIFGGVLFDRFDQRLLLFTSLTWTAIAVGATPWCKNFGALMTAMSLMGAGMGFLDTGGNVMCIDLWGKDSGPYMQALHFSFGAGAFVAPLLAEPFLSPIIDENDGGLAISPENSLEFSTHTWRDKRSINLNKSDPNIHFPLLVNDTADIIDDSSSNSSLIPSALNLNDSEMTPNGTGYQNVVIAKNDSSFTNRRENDSSVQSGESLSAAIFDSVALTPSLASDSISSTEFLQNAERNISNQISTDSSVIVNLSDNDYASLKPFENVSDIITAPNVPQTAMLPLEQTTKRIPKPKPQVNDGENLDNSTAMLPLEQTTKRIPKPKPQVNDGENLDNSVNWEKIKLFENVSDIITASNVPQTAMLPLEQTTKRIPKPKPQVNDGENLDNSVNWEKIKLPNPTPGTLPVTTTQTPVNSTDLNNTTVQPSVDNQKISTNTSVGNMSITAEVRTQQPSILSVQPNMNTILVNKNITPETSTGITNSPYSTIDVNDTLLDETRTVLDPTVQSSVDMSSKGMGEEPSVTNYYSKVDSNNFINEVDPRGLDQSDILLTKSIQHFDFSNMTTNVIPESTVNDSLIAKSIPQADNSNIELTNDSIAIGKVSSAADSEKLNPTNEMVSGSKTTESSIIMSTASSVVFQYSFTVKTDENITSTNMPEMYNPNTENIVSPDASKGDLPVLSSSSSRQFITNAYGDSESVFKVFSSTVYTPKSQAGSFWSGSVAKEENLTTTKTAENSVSVTISSEAVSKSVEDKIVTSRYGDSQGESEQHHIDGRLRIKDESNIEMSTPHSSTAKPKVHYSKPQNTFSSGNDDNTYPNDGFSETIEKYGVTKIHIAYIIIAALTFHVGLIFLCFLCKKKGKQVRPVVMDKPAQVEGKVRVFILVSLLSLFFLLYVGMEVAYGQLVMTFSVRSELGLSKSQGSYITAVFWGSFAAFRFISIFLARFLQPSNLLFIDFILTSTGSVILSIGASSSETCLRIGTALVGSGMANVFPSGFLWAEQHLSVSNKMASVFVVGAAAGEMICPLIGGMLVEYEPMTLMYELLVTNCLCIITFFFALFIANIARKNNRSALLEYQLANEYDEDEMVNFPSGRNHGRLLVR
ncbi:hypothetical protein QYM36_009282 [Artemia franciscana]|uniref:Sodium-dependent glucose transporter 1 n=1 Tax=Artemia franciscana TaxID=6661 RepID=A0AA88HTB6_ARTSF|nr:hypothetical protein QYM36_009282 [Artemia franciscana]